MSVFRPRTSVASHSLAIAPTGVDRAATARVMRAFEQNDKDENGLISMDELRRVMKQLGGGFSEVNCETLVRTAGCNTPGGIDYKELLEWIFSGGAPYVLLQEFVPQGLRCVEGHDLDQFCPKVDGHCCQECGDDLDVGSQVLICRDCGGLEYCVRCSVELNARGRSDAADREEALLDGVAGAEALFEGRVETIAEENDWPGKVKGILCRWPPIGLDVIEDVLIMNGNVENLWEELDLDQSYCDGDIPRKTVHRWLARHLPEDRYDEIIELRTFLHERGLEELVPYIGDGSMERLKQLREGSPTFRELSRRLPSSAMQSLQEAGSAVVDAEIRLLSHQLEWEDLIYEFRQQVPGVQRQDLTQVLASSAGLYDSIGRCTDNVLEAALERWLDNHLANSPPLGGKPTIRNAQRTAVVSVEVPEDAYAGDVIRVPYAGLMLPMRVPQGARSGELVEVVVPATSAAQMLGVEYHVGEDVQVSLPGTDVHNRVGRVLELQVSKNRVVVELDGRVLGFSPSTLRPALAAPQPGFLQRHMSAPANFAAGALLRPAVKAVAPKPARAAVVVAAADDGPAAAQPVLTRQKSLAEAAIGEKFGAYPPHDLDRQVGFCAICMDDSKEVLRLCGTEDCDGTICEECLVGYINSLIDSSFYAMPMLRCPGCRARVQTGIWEPFVEQERRTRYQKVGEALAEFRCGGCHQSRTLWEQYDNRLREAAVFSNASNLQVIRAGWQQFNRDLITPDDLWKSIVTGFEGAGAAMGNEIVHESIPFKHVLGLIEDDERRLALQLAAVRKHPRIQTYCCQVMMCFGCKLSWHHGRTCIEMRQREASKDVQFCPNCGVATIKSEGCNHMVCPCGTHWSWGTNPKVGELLRAIRDQNYDGIRRMRPSESVVTEVLTTLAWDRVDFLHALPVLWEDGELSGPGPLSEVWRVVSGMSQLPAARTLQLIIAQWSGPDASALWSTSLQAYRLINNQNYTWQEVLPIMLERARGNKTILLEFWSTFVQSGKRARKAGRTPTLEVLAMILEAAGVGTEGASGGDEVAASRFLDGVCEAVGGSDLDMGEILAFLFKRDTGGNATFVTSAWRGVLQGRGRLNAVQVGELFTEIFKTARSKPQLLATLLGPSAEHGHIESLEALLKANVDPNAVSLGSGAPAALVAASAHAQPEAVQLLLAAGAHPAVGNPLNAVLRDAMDVQAVYDEVGDQYPRKFLVKYTARDDVMTGGDLTFKPRRKPLALLPPWQQQGAAPAAKARAASPARRGGTTANRGNASPRGARGGAGGRSGQQNVLPPAGAYRWAGRAIHPTIVATVNPRSPAARCGVKPGDVLVLVENDAKVKKDEEELSRVDPTAVLKRVAVPAQLLIDNTFHRQCAAVEVDWQKRTVVVELLLAAKADAAAVHGPVNDTPLVMASRIGVARQVSQLLQKGALGENADFAHRVWGEALRAACRFGNSEVVDVLMQHKPEGASIDEPGDLPMYLVTRHMVATSSFWQTKYCRYGDATRVTMCPKVSLDWDRRVNIIQRLLRSQAAVDAPRYQTSPLWYVAEAGCTPAMRCLADAGGTLRGGTLTSLHRAAAALYADTVTVLVQIGAEVSASDADYMRSQGLQAAPLIGACAADPPARVEQVDQRNIRKDEWALRLEIARELIRAGASVNDTPAGSPTAIAVAARAGHAELVELLLENGARPQGQGADYSEEADAMLACARGCIPWPREWEEGEQEAEYYGRPAPYWYNAIQKKDWELNEWRRYRNARTLRREGRAKRLKLANVVHKADTAARIQILNRFQGLGCRGAPAVVEAATRGATAAVSHLLRAGVPMDPRLQWCPVCKRPVLLSAPPAAAGSWGAMPEVLCGCGASWLLAPGALHSLVVACDTEMLNVHVPLMGAGYAQQLWNFAGEVLATHGGDFLPVAAPNWGASGDAPRTLIALTVLGANVNSVLPSGRNMLWIACNVGHLAVVDTLIGLGANPQMASKEGFEDAAIKMPIQAAAHLANAADRYQMTLRVASKCPGIHVLPEEIERSIVYPEMDGNGRICQLESGLERVRAEHQRQNQRQRARQEDPFAKLAKTIKGFRDKLNPKDEEEEPVEPPVPHDLVLEKKRQARDANARGGTGSQSVASARLGASSPAARRGAAARPKAASARPSSPRGARSSGASPALADRTVAGISLPALAETLAVRFGNTVEGVRVDEVRPGGPAEAAGVAPAWQLVAAREDASSEDFRGQALTGAPDKVLAKLDTPKCLTFRMPTLDFKYKESPLKAIVFKPTAQGFLRVDSLLVVPGKDSDPGGDADAYRCQVIMKRVLGAVDGESVMHMTAANALKKVDKPGVTLTFISSFAEAEAVQDLQVDQRARIVQSLCVAGASPTVQGTAEMNAPIVKAARAGLLPVVAAFANTGVQPLELALGAACEMGHSTLVDLLLNRLPPTSFLFRGAQQGLAPVLMAIRGTTRRELEWCKGWTVPQRESVERAAGFNDTRARAQICQRLVARQVDPDNVEPSGVSAMHWAAVQWDVQKATFLHELGASVSPSVVRTTPLHLVCKTKFREFEKPKGMIDFLLNNSAMVDSHDDNQATPLLYALRAFDRPDWKAGGTAVRGVFSVEETARFQLMAHLIGRGADVSRSMPESLLHAAIRISARESTEELARQKLPLPSERRRPWPVVVRLFEMQVFPDCRDASGLSPLSLAVQLQATDIAKWLCSLPATLNLDAPLTLAAGLGEPEMVEFLLDRQADANGALAGDLGKLPPLHIAASGGFAAVQSLLLQHQADVNMRAPDANGDERTALHFVSAAPADPTENSQIRSGMAAQLLHWGAEVDARSSSGWTSLFLAAEQGRSRVLSELLRAKADVSQEAAFSGANEGTTVLHLLVAGTTRKDSIGADEMRSLISELLRSGATLSARDKMGRTPMHCAAKVGNVATLLTLIAKEADPHDRDKDGLAPLHYIAQSDSDKETSLDLMHYLLDPRTNAINTTVDKTERGALHHASMRGQVGFMEALLERRADPRRQDDEGESALHLAAKYMGCQLSHATFGESRRSPRGGTVENYSEAISILLDKDAELQRKNNNNNTALDLAVAAMACEAEKAQTLIEEIAPRLLESAS